METRYLIAGAIMVVALAACSGSASKASTVSTAPKLHTITGILAIMNDVGVTSCPPPPVPDIAIADDAALYPLLATAPLSPAVPVTALGRSGCRYDFTVTRVPDRAGYQISEDGPQRGEPVHYTRAQLDAAGWRVNLTEAPVG